MVDLTMQIRQRCHNTGKEKHGLIVIKTDMMKTVSKNNYKKRNEK
jgi:hypothetical protein